MKIPLLVLLYNHAASAGQESRVSVLTILNYGQFRQEQVAEHGANNIIHITRTKSDATIRGSPQRR